MSVWKRGWEGRRESEGTGSHWRPEASIKERDAKAGTWGWRGGGLCRDLRATVRPENQLAVGGRGAGVPTCSLLWIRKVGAWLAGVTLWRGLCMASTLAASGTTQGLIEITPCWDSVLTVPFPTEASERGLCQGLRKSPR